LKEITVGTAPRSIAVAPSGRIWVTNKPSNTISLIDPTTLAVAQTVTLPRASQPFGIAFSPTGNYAYVVLEATGQLLRLNPATGATVSTLAVGANPRHVSVNSDGSGVLVSRFITPPLPGENTAVVQTNTVGGEVVAVSASTMTIAGTITLAHSDAPDFENQGRGVPNYLGAATISPDGTQAWVPSKQDNILRGTGRDGQNLNFQNTVRAITSRIVMSTGMEDLGARIDHDNSSVASAVAYDPRGVYMFVALETSREVAVIDAHNHWEIFRINVGRAPQGLTLSANGNTLYVNNFMDRTISAFDLTNLMTKGTTDVPLLGTMNAVATEKLAATVLKGKQFFYDARDTRLARDRYMSCASCHNDGGQDGRVWDLTGMGEGLRNTISLRGRANAQGYLHWSANFDEVQDFEGQIRTLAGGTGLMSDANFNSGTRSQPLGDAKAGLSADLDALAAYVGSLNTFSNSPYRNSDGTLTTAAVAGRAVFESNNCASCHGGTRFTVSGSPTLFNIGTIKPTSGQRLGGALPGIDPPTLRDVWATAPYLHDGSASTLANAVTAHQGVSITGTNLTNLVAFLQQIGGEEIAGCPCTLWKPTDVPASSSYDTTSRGGIELGTRFRASTTGYIKSIRFYKHTGNTGTHVGSLWSNSGSLLGRATFSNETATGWQEVKLATPIKVTAGTWYMVSYLTKSGKFIGQNGLFSSSGMTNGPLYAPRDGEASYNGGYRYTSTSAFPTRDGNGQGYWVDVVFVNQ
jgi:YVTN family beta-propeller protein